MARLDSLEPIIFGSQKEEEKDQPQQPAGGKKRKIDGDKDNTNGKGTREADDSSSSKATVDWSGLETEMESLVQKEDATKVLAFLKSLEETYVPSELEQQKLEQEHFVTLPPVLEKEQRRALHGWIKQRLSFCAAADTVDGKVIRIWHRSFASLMPHTMDNNRHAASSHQRQKALMGPPKDKPFLRFVLYKENMDTGAAMQQIAKRAVPFSARNNNSRGRGGGRHGGRGNNANRTVRLGYAGNKDKRGVTTQFITIPVHDTSIKHLCNVFNGGNTNTNGGGGHTQSAGVGLMRVGNFEYCANQLQLGRLIGNRFDVALRNVTLTTPAVDNTKAERMWSNVFTIKKVLEKSAKSIQTYGFINYFGTQRFGKYHDTHLTGMAVLRGDFQAAVDMILEPKTNDRADVYAAREEWQNRFKDLSESGDRATVEKETATKVLKSMNAYMQSENAILNSLLRHPLDYKKAFLSITKTMRMMFVHAFQSFVWNKMASYRISQMGRSVIKGDLVLSDISSALLDHSNGQGCPEVHVVNEDDIDSKTYSIEDVVLPLIGVNTRNPENGSGEIIDTVLMENKLTREMINTLDGSDFHCAGDYRKLICRPTDIDHEIIEYKDELQPLLQTDFMKLQGIEVARMSETTTNNAVDEKSPLVGMVVGFTLPSSSYATIFLRELMKRPTSSEYQRELKLGDDIGIESGDVKDDGGKDPTL